MRYLVTAILCLIMGVGYGQAPVVGDYYGGGVVFWVNPDDNMQGLVCLDHDLTPSPWPDAISSCESLIANGFSDWRLPDRTELQEMCFQTSIIDAVASGMPNGGYFNTTYTGWGGSSWYFTSEPRNQFTPPGAWIVGFEDCHIEDSHQYLSLGVRPVRSYTYNPQTTPCNNQTSVTYQGYDYDIVEIGDQCWFAENCRYLPSVSPSSEASITEPHYYVYDYEGTDVVQAISTENYEAYGVLYNWPAVITDQVCPSGWKIPSFEDVDVLIDEFGGSLTAGYHLKSENGWAENGHGSNSSGFNGYPGGYRISAGFYGQTEDAYWWTTTQIEDQQKSLWLYYLNINYASSWNSGKENGLSVRCLKNQLIVQIPGCTDSTASNYDPDATEDDGSCCYEEWGDEWVQIGQDIDGVNNYDRVGANSLSDNGKILAVGSESAYNKGSVKVYEDINGSWVQIGQEIIGTDDYEYFHEVSLSGSGNILAIGAPQFTVNEEVIGRITIYEYISGSWIQIGNDIYGENNGDNLGNYYNLSLNHNGDVLVVGLDQSDGVRVYNLINGSWVKTLDMTGESSYAKAADINDAGDIIAFGNWSDKVEIWQKIGDTWQIMGQPLINTSNNSGSGYGFSVSLNEAGNIVSVGARSAYVEGVSTGKVFIYQFNGSSWGQIGNDINGLYQYDQFGQSVSLNNSGDIVAVGANGANTNNEGGQVRIFKNINQSWIQLGGNINGDSISGGAFGWPVSISGDGSRFSSGAYYYNNQRGRVRVFNIFNPCDTPGCTDDIACNYNPDATESDCSCLYTEDSCDDSDESTLNDTIQEDCSCSGEALCVASECCISGTQWDLNTMTCVYEDACSADIAKDGFVAVDDLLELLSAFGNSCEEVSLGIGGEECIGAECCGENTIWCETLEICIPFISCPADLNEDESIGSIDLLVFLPYYGGDCEDYESLPDCEVTDTPWMCGDPINYQGYDYETVMIGEQCWFAENLRIESYLNGDLIQGDVISADWDLLSEGAQTIYGEGQALVYDGNDDEESNFQTYGRLYNWYAVSDERHLCPSGWYVPLVGDLEELVSQLGGESSALESLKGNSSSSGFDGLFGGRRTGLGSFYYEGTQGSFWSSSPNLEDLDGTDALNLILCSNCEQLIWDSTSKKVGYSVRCIKD